jgi:hypothetical protein
MLGIPDVARHDLDRTGNGLNGCPGGVEVVGLAARYDQIGPEPGELDCDGFPQAGPAAGDQHGLAVVRADRERAGSLCWRLGQTEQVRHAQLPV